MVRTALLNAVSVEAEVSWALRLTVGSPTHIVMRGALTNRGWTPCGSGDWAVALRSPSGRIAARISPFDPAYPFTVLLYSDGAELDHLPRLVGHAELDGGGCLQLLEFLYPSDINTARDFYRQLSNDHADPQIRSAAALLRQIHRRAEQQLPWCGPLDDNPANVMLDENGRPVLIDPFYMRGHVLFEMLRVEPATVAARIPASRRRHLFDIPAMQRGSNPSGLERLRAALAEADAAAT